MAVATTWSTTAGSLSSPTTATARPAAPSAAVTVSSPAQHPRSR